jgi:hypothetical protein
VTPTDHQSRWVYFVQSGGEFGPVKIGITNNIAKRLEALNTHGPEPVRCLHKLDCGSTAEARAMESNLHHLFAAHRIHGEWFRWNDEFVDLLKGLIQIEKTFGPEGARLNVQFEIVRLQECGIRFRPTNRHTADAVSRSLEIASGGAIKMVGNVPGWTTATALERVALPLARIAARYKAILVVDCSVFPVDIRAVSPSGDVCVECGERIHRDGPPDVLPIRGQHGTPNVVVRTCLRHDNAPFEGAPT